MRRAKLCFVLCLWLCTALHCRASRQGWVRGSEPAADAQAPSEPPAPKLKLSPTLLLISLDGFRWDYFHKASTPHLDRLRKEGTQAKALIPVFPSKTFPNHYTIVTGLYPEHHGIVSNTMYDPVFGALFRITDGQATADGRWWEGEPIWVTAVRQGQRSATMFWPGSEASIGGVRPTYWRPYNSRLSHDARIQQLFQWLELPEPLRPTMLTLYLSDVDSAGHSAGPDSSDVALAIERVDATLGKLLRGLEDRRALDQIDIVVVSDHGMLQLDPKKRIYLEDYIALDDVFINDLSGVVGLNPKAGKLEQVFRQLSGKHPQLAVYKKADVPARFHYNHHRRISEIVAIPTPGWSVDPKRGTDLFHQGAHGFDPQHPSMHGVFVARGPSFRKGAVIEAFESVHLYALFCHLLGLKPAKNDGSLNPLLPALRR